MVKSDALDKPRPTRPVLTTIGEFQCRWPLWSGRVVPVWTEQYVCGSPVAAPPYCPVCAKKAFKAEQPRRRGALSPAPRPEYRSKGRF